MLNWDDLKFYLAVCREGSVRAAASHLEVNHATVSRRINSFEKSLGQSLFNRTSQGYVRTKLGDEIYNEASYLEERLSNIDRKIVGKDTELSGELRITLPDLLGESLLLPGILEFCRQYPRIEMEILDSAKFLNLANREADVAIRVVSNPPDYLVGRRLAVIHRACYVSAEYADKVENKDWLEQQYWLGWTDKQRKPIGKIARDYPKLESRHKIANSNMRAIAARAGFGVAILPCFMGDVDPELIRIPPYSTEEKFDMWILYHPDMRSNAKINCFVKFMTEYTLKFKDLIEGKSPQ